MKGKLMLAVGATVITVMTSGALSLNARGKIKVCHREGNGKAHVIEIADSALNAHLNHGDSLESAVGLKAGEACQLAVGGGVLK